MVSVHGHAPADHDSGRRSGGRALTSIMAIRQMKVDIFPKLGAPAIYVARAYQRHRSLADGGDLTYYYEYHFLYITGHRACRVEEHPGRRADEAGVSSGDRHEPGDGEKSSATLTARARSCRRARCRRSSCGSSRQRPGCAARVFERHADAR